MAELNLQVAASSDDCMMVWTMGAWLFDLNESNVVGQWSGCNVPGGITKAGGGVRFLNVAIPQGATIDAAYLIFTAKETNSQATVNSVIIGDDEDNAAAFSTKADYQSRRGTVVGGSNDDKITSASVNWDGIPAWTAESTYNSPELKTIIQEIINRAGWASGNALALFWDDHADRSTHSGVCRRQGYCWDSSSAKCAKLHIEYTPSGGGPARRSLAYIIG